MKKIRKFTVVPSLPSRLEPLRRVAYNLWWVWTPDAESLFRRLDRELWRQTHHNPVRMLGLVSQERLVERLGDEGFLAHMDRVDEALAKYMNDEPWFQKNHPRIQELSVAYFSAEFGLTECLPIYSGGLGVLAGDHLKSASDLGLPLVGVGLLYHEGYFQQYLNADGWQQETYNATDFYNSPFEKVRGEDGEPLRVSVEIKGRTVWARTWKVQVGRVPLYLLDTNVEGNSPEDREITARLYGGDLDMRIRQEILLGIGGYRMLRALGKDPSVCHMNEGHSAFLSLERARLLMEAKGMSFAEAREASRPGNVFTTHTPVPAGNDRFPPENLRPYFESYAGSFGLAWKDFLALGREDATDGNEAFCMTVLAMRMADRSNGVSKLHGDVSRHMWAGMWPELPVDEVPVRSITNGIHIHTWISNDMAGLLDRYLGPRWVREPHNQQVWARMNDIPDEEMWRTHERRRERLVAFARRRLRAQYARQGGDARDLRLADEVLDPEALTIGFARRFAPYKRATLLFRDLERLSRSLAHRDRPVQFIFAGKAHPRDEKGKSLIRNIVHAARDSVLRRRVVFLEDYDMEVARYLVQGVDVWLNTPRRPLEASGTSGMKAAANGVLNMSVLDGWWCEAYSPEVGWAIGEGEEYGEQVELQDEVESNAAYDLLEKEVIPTFYERTGDGLPRKWVAKMKATMQRVGPQFNTHRMVSDYLEYAYRPAHLRLGVMAEDDNGRAKALAAWKARMAAHWDAITVEHVSDESDLTLSVGDELEVTADVRLGALTPEDVSVELYTGELGPDDQMNGPGAATRMGVEGPLDDGLYRFKGAVSCRTSGRQGYGLRILPRHRDMADPYGLYVIKWA